MKLLDGFYGQLKSESAKVGVTVYRQFVDEKGSVLVDLSDAVPAEHSSEAKVMSIGESSEQFFSAFKGRTGAIVTESRLAQDGQLNLLPDGQIAVAAVLVAFADDLFEPEAVLQFLQSSTGMKLEGKSAIKHLQHLPQDATPQMFSQLGLIVPRIKAMAYNAMLSVYRTMQVALGAAA
jgi:hypothetical protein